MRSLIPAAMLLAAAPAWSGDVSLRRSGEAPEAVRAWFGDLERFYEQTGGVLSTLAEAAAAPTAAQARAAADALAAAAPLYGRISGDEAGAKSLRETLQQDLRRASGDGALHQKLISRLYGLDAKGEPSLLRLTLLARQEALKAPGPKGAFPPNMLLSTPRGEVPLLDVSGGGLLDGAGAPTPALAALLAVAEHSAIGAGSFVVSAERLWMRRGGADFYADFSARAHEGLVRLRVDLPGGDTATQARWYFLTKALLEAGFTVGIQGGELTAFVAADAAALTPSVRRDRVVMAWRALEAALALKDAMGPYLAGTLSRAENDKRVDALAAAFAAEGRLPEAGAGPDRVAKGMAAYAGKAAAREALRGRMDRTLRALGLRGFPSGVPVGQRTVDLYYNAPLEAALAAGELRRDGAVFRRARPRARAAPGVAAGAVLAPGRVEAPLTYDSKKAAGGGFVFATPHLGIKDRAAAEAMQGLLTSGGGALARILAARAGVPALRVDARWNDGAGLSVEIPLYEGRRFVGWGETLLREGDRVRLEDGRLTVLPAAPPSVSGSLALPTTAP